MKNYDVAIVGAGPGGIYAAYELIKKNPALSVVVLEAGHSLEKRHCPIDGKKIKSCISCKSCSIMSGFGGAGAFSDGKYNITNDFGGTLYEYIGKEEALSLMKYVDEINMEHGGEGTRLFSTAGTKFKKLCMQNRLKLLDASVRHLGTDINYVVLEKLYTELKDKVEFHFDTPVEKIEIQGRREEKEKSSAEKNKEKVYCESYLLHTGKEDFSARRCIVSVGRSGSKWMEKVCDELELFEDNVRTFCMNPNGIVVNENTNGIVTVNGHSYEGEDKHTENTNFALLVAKHFSEPFKDSNGYGESIARLSNMLGGGVIVQRFGDLVRGRRSNQKRIEEGMVQPTLKATPGDLSLVLPKRILDGIMEMIYALDKIAPGTANEDTLLYGVEVKFYNMEVALDEHLETKYKGFYVIGDGSGVTHSLSHASASGIFVAREIAEAGKL